MGRRAQKKLSLLTVGAFFLCLFFAFFSGFFRLSVLPAALAEATCDYVPPTFKKISSFSTWFSRNDGGRCANIALAASRIDGVIVQAYGEFSFNQTVGKRTRSAGFQQAKIIAKGEYVMGVGGGVCQVSTTLYNAALLAGLTVEEARQHSLQVSYVPPSRDAMVSSESDLRLFNPYAFPVKLSVKVSGEILTAAVYGEPIGESYKIVSVELSAVPPPAPIVVTETSELQEREAKDGVISEAYLERYQNGILIARTKLRKDFYAPIPAVVKKIADTTKKIRSNPCFFL